jgi:hypothetical protein
VLGVSGTSTLLVTRGELVPAAEYLRISYYERQFAAFLGWARPPVKPRRIR